MFSYLNSKVRAAWQTYGVGFILAIAIVGAYKGYESYKHFTWLTITASDNKTNYAIPGWSK